MTLAALSLAEGVSPLSAFAVLGLGLASLAFLLFELRKREGVAVWVLVSGALSLLLVAAAVLRPARVNTRGVSVGARVVVLVDESRRLLLPSDGKTRRELALRAADAVSKHFAGARVALRGFGAGELHPLVVADELAHTNARALSDESDLSTALNALSQEPGERPKAVVVVSDGRFSRPGAALDDAALREVTSALGAPIHTVAVSEQAPRDASIRSIRTSGATVAHQALALTIEIGCGGGLSCTEVPVVARELRQGVEPFVLASGVAKMTGETATVELSITLERAGARLVEVSIEPPAGDTIPENNTRIITFSVTRDRLRLLHVAGRPTYDVRALRMWLKSDESVDLIAFFILRTDEDNTETSEDSELALIPFPVDELFTEHLPSFDAVILQDIDAVAYKLSRHLPALANYVRGGGGLIMVGGPSAFAGGGYARSPLEGVLPVELNGGDQPFDTADFVPRYTEAGRSAPVLRGLSDLFADELPTFTGSNTLGAARPNAITLWEHPERRVGKTPMPVLALGESGDGRSIALGVDGTHALAFSEFADRAAGRAYGALWDGLVGWLMRDPRYEALRLELSGPCIAGLPASLRLVRLPGTTGDVSLQLTRLGPQRSPVVSKTVKEPAPNALELELGALDVGGYSASARVGAAPPTRFDFACERGGPAWSDSRPDPERLARIAKVSGGRAVSSTQIGDLPVPAPIEVAAERSSAPLLPAWAWTLAASLALGGHWYARRRQGLL
ncbi:MAG TPA: glutamine amidotransferase [Polyangiaceae bacterium]|nr:glutamine amidotransferase [Polyangiaceae bacterium]